MSDQIGYYEAFEMFAFDEDATKCLCHGSGWALSDRDSWHKCPYHWKNSKDTPLPEDDGGCPECGDGENYPPDRCSLCGQHIRDQMADNWNDNAPPIPPDYPTTDGLPASECPF